MKIYVTGFNLVYGVYCSYVECLIKSNKWKNKMKLCPECITNGL